MFLKYLKQHLPLILLFLSFAAIFTAYLALMDVNIMIALYPLLLCIAIGITFMALDYSKEKKKLKTLSEIKDFVQAQSLPTSEDPTEEEYMRIIESLSGIYKKDMAEMRSSSSDYSDYLNMWVHQIKNPIASMRLELDAMDSEEARRLKGELNRIEHYVDMVLVYSRLGSDTTDYLFEKVNIRKAASDAVKRFKENFISKGIAIDMNVEDMEVLTDRKWLGFILEQYISNALKYTSSGRIRIYNEGTRVFIEDTGVGIRPEDMERIWEKGYTGMNGRSVSNSSGLGLYLVKKTADRLKHTVGAESPAGGGARFFIDLEKKERLYE